MIKDHYDITVVLILFVRLAKIFEITNSFTLRSNEIENEWIDDC
jgi:pilus assembly protein TadC